MKFSFVLFALIAAVFVGNGKFEAQAQTYTALTPLPSGTAAWGRLQHGSGTLYGTSYGTSVDPPGRVFSIDLGTKAYGTVHSFGVVSGDGTKPFAGLAADHSGASSPWYGTTTSGGLYGYGMVFKVVPSTSYGHLHDFAGGTDGSQPKAVLARPNNMTYGTAISYGTTYAGGSSDCGTVFSVDDSGSPYNNLYSFKGSASNDGCGSMTQLQGSSGCLIGATIYGGSSNKGTIFALKKDPMTGIWSEYVIYQFTGGTDGSSPIDLDVDVEGNIYGVAQSDGPSGNGVVFELTTTSSSPCSSTWTYNALYPFSASNDGVQPNGIRYFRTNKKLYGTTWQGGANNLGTVFELTPPVVSGGTWTESFQHSFSGGMSDGANPPSRPLLDENSCLIYGTTISGGTNGNGIVYEVTGLC